MNQKARKNKIYKLGLNILRKRKQMDFSQNIFAEKLDISKEHLAKIETIKRIIGLNLLIKIAKVFDVKVNALIDFNR